MQTMDKMTLNYKITIEEDNGTIKKYIRIFEDIFEEEAVANKLIQQKKVGIIKDFKLEQFNINEHKLTMKQLLNSEYEISLADFITIINSFRKD